MSGRVTGHGSGPLRPLSRFTGTLGAPDSHRRPAVNPPDGGPCTSPEDTMTIVNLHAVTFPGVIPPGDRSHLDGAVAELQVNPDGTVTAEIRIPAPQPERM
jgi:hypothetical protein